MPGKDRAKQEGREMFQIEWTDGNGQWLRPRRVGPLGDLNKFDTPEEAEAVLAEMRRYGRLGLGDDLRRDGVWYDSDDLRVVGEDGCVA